MIRKRAAKAIGLTMLGFTLGGAVGLPIASRLFLFSFLSIAVAGALAGWFLSSALHDFQFSSTQKPPGTVQIWGIVGGVAGILAIFLAFIIGPVAALVIGGAVGGMLGGAATLNRLLSSTQLKRIIIGTIGWAVGGAAGGATCVLLLSIDDLSVYGFDDALALGGAIGGAIFGAIGSGIMFWQLANLQSPVTISRGE